jgi:Bifunctional DNA primase/polymerase, N-terminal/Primase C terminal 1 (PriCT-1)/DnaB-like helicase C terminal domain
MTLKEAALSWADLGYKIFPCAPRSKMPLHPGAGGLYEATSDKATIERWWTATPDANIGLPTGATNGLTIVDVDSTESLKEFGLDGASAPMTYSPAGGFHLRMPYAHGIKNYVKFKPGLDIRNDGGYVMVGPSVHPDGGVYKTRPDVLLDWPDSLLSFLKSYKAPIKAERNEGGLVPIGGRNNYLTSIAGALQRKGVSRAALSAALHAENETNLEEPLSEHEVDAIVNSVGNYSPEPVALSNATALTGVASDDQGELLPLSGLSSQLVSYLSDKAKVKGEPTGLEGLDKMLGGGKRLGEVTCWHAEAKTGKNTLWHYLMYLMLEQNIPLAYASRELSPAEEVVPNLLSVAFGENSWLVDLDAERQSRYSGKLTAWPLYFSNGYGYFAAQDIRAWVLKAKAKGVQYFWFDHLHYMLEDPEDHKAASKLIKDLKALAKTENIHIDIIIQPNKLMDGQRLSLNSIKGGSAMGQAIDNLLILERVRGATNIAKLTLEVARSKLCKPGSIHLQFDPVTTRFGETEPEATPNSLQPPIVETHDNDSPLAAANRMIRRGYDDKSLSHPGRVLIATNGDGRTFISNTTE